MEELTVKHYEQCMHELPMGVVMVEGSSKIFVLGILMFKGIFRKSVYFFMSYLRLPKEREESKKQISYILLATYLKFNSK